MQRFFVIPLLMGVALVITALFFNGAGIGLYWDVPSFILCLGIPYLVLSSTFSHREMAAAYRNAVTLADLSILEVKRGLVFFRAMERQLYFAGAGATFYGIIAMLAHSEDSTMIGKGLAVALITLLYSILFNQFGIAPFKNALEKKIAKLE